MARERMVTRTVIATKVVALTIDTVTCEPMNVVYTVGGVYADNEKLLKVIKKLHETETQKIVSIVSKEETETLYGMSENEFIAQAKVLPPRTVKENKD